MDKQINYSMLCRQCKTQHDLAVKLERNHWWICKDCVELQYPSRETRQAETFSSWWRNATKAILQILRP